MQIIVFGDDIAYGAFDRVNGGWVNRLKCFMFDHGCTVYNSAALFRTSWDILAGINGEMDRLWAHKDINTKIIFALGLNDCICIGKNGKPQISLKSFAQNLDRLYDMATLGHEKYASDICFIGLSLVDDERAQRMIGTNYFYYNVEIKKYNAAIKKFCESKGALFIDIMEHVKCSTMPNGIHPDAAGHHIIFNLVKNSIKHWYK